MNTIFKVIGYRTSRLLDYAMNISSDSNLRGDNMTLEDLSELIKTKMSGFAAMYRQTRFEISDDKLFIFEDGKLVSLIIERFKL